MWSRPNSDSFNVLAALMKSQAIIEFKPDGTIIGANGIFLDAMGYTLEEIAGKHHSMFVESDYAGSMEYKEFWETLRQGRFHQEEFKRFGRHGKEIWIQASYNPVTDAGGKILKIVKLATDITDRKLIAADNLGQLAAIRKSQAVIEFNLDGTIIGANGNFLETLGYRLEEIVGKHHSMFVEPEDRDCVDYTRFWDGIRAGNFQSGEFKRIGKGGREVWIQATYNPIADMNGNLFKVVKYASDTTKIVNERLQREDATRDMDRQFSEITEIVEHAAQQSITAAEATNETSSSVQSVAAGAEELSSSVAEISRQVTQALEITSNAVNEAELTSGIIGGLAESVLKINEVVELISNIAKQTNLLALNATIEAARAGESGKGFAVVASEVKMLANQTAQATDQIGGQISEVQTATNAAVKAIEAFSGTISEINEISSSIGSAVDEQTSVTQEISGSMQTASNRVEMIAVNVKEIASATQQIKQINDATTEVWEASRAIG